MSFQPVKFYQTGTFTVGNRLLPEDQRPGAPWQQVGTEPIAVGGPRDRAIGQLIDRLRIAPIIASDEAPAAPAADPARSERRRAAAPQAPSGASADRQAARRRPAT